MAFFPFCFGTEVFPGFFRLSSRSDSDSLESVSTEACPDDGEYLSENDWAISLHSLRSYLPRKELLSHLHATPPSLKLQLERMHKSCKIT